MGLVKHSFTPHARREPSLGRDDTGRVKNSPPRSARVRVATGHTEDLHSPVPIMTSRQRGNTQAPLMLQDEGQRPRNETILHGSIKTDIGYGASVRRQTDNSRTYGPRERNWNYISGNAGEPLGRRTAWTMNKEWEGGRKKILLDTQQEPNSFLVVTRDATTSSSWPYQKWSLERLSHLRFQIAVREKHPSATSAQPCLSSRPYLMRALAQLRLSISLWDRTTITLKVPDCDAGETPQRNIGTTLPKFQTLPDEGFGTTKAIHKLMG